MLNEILMAGFSRPKSLLEAAVAQNIWERRELVSSLWWRIVKERCLPLFKDILMAGFEICLKSKDLVGAITVQSQSVLCKVKSKGEDEILLFIENLWIWIYPEQINWKQKHAFLRLTMLSCRRRMWVVRATVATFTLTWAQWASHCDCLSSMGNPLWLLELAGEATVTAVSEPVLWPLHWPLFPHDKRSTWCNQTK